jgi:hypothetical protein
MLPRFDYQSPTDFKFAGINVSANKIEIGHQASKAGRSTRKSPRRVPEIGHGLQPVPLFERDHRYFEGHDNVALSVTFSPARTPWLLHGLNDGMVGVGARNAQAQIDNLAVQRLTPLITLDRTDEFDSGVSDLSRRHSWALGPLSKGATKRLPGRAPPRSTLDPEGGPSS